MRHKIHIKIKNRNKLKTTFTMRISVPFTKSRSFEYWQFIKNAGTVRLCEGRYGKESLVNECQRWEFRFCQISDESSE